MSDPTPDAVAAVAGPADLLAVVPVRGGVLPAGGPEAVAEARGRALLAGDGTAGAAAALTGVVGDDGSAVAAVQTWEAGDFAPARWAATLAPVLRDERIIVLPASPDGRDLAPRLAAALGRPLIAGAVLICADHAACARWGGRTLEEVPIPATGAVVTLQPGVRGVELRGGEVAPEVEPLDLPAGADPGGGPHDDRPADAEVLEVLPPDVATMDLAEAPRILGGGAGLGGDAEFALLGRVATALGASLGATRVVTDTGLVSHDRQIGTTGVAVAPRLYVAFGVSGAVQHTAGLGDPTHIVAVNTDPHCPMMAMADLAIVCDAAALVRELAARLGIDPGTGGGGPAAGADACAATVGTAQPGGTTGAPADGGTDG